MLLPLLCMLGFVSGAPAQQSSLPDAPVPLLFEPNMGQAPHSVKFVARGSGYQALLTEDQLILSVQRSAGGNSAKPAGPAFVRLRWLGTQGGTHLYGQRRLASYSNYFYGPDQKQWAVRVPHFASVLQANAKPGPSLHFYATPRQQLEYDLSVNSATDASQVGFQVIGADSVQVSSNGDLIVRIGDAEFRQLAPRAYELRGGHRQALGAHYILQAENIVRYFVQGRTSGSTLVIDPILQYSTYLAGSTTSGDSTIAQSSGISTAVDKAGNVYVTGSTDALDFPATAGSYEPECPGPGSQAGCATRPVAYVAKFNRSGQLVYATYLSGLYGTNYWDPAGKLVAVDAKQDVYVTGGAFGGFPVTSNAFQQDCAFETDSACAFLTKLSSDGSKLLYSTYFGNGFPMTDWTVANGLAIGAQGDVYIAGRAETPELPTTPGVFQATCPDLYLGGCRSGFVARFNTSMIGDASLVYATYLGEASENGQTSSEADGIAVDAAGNAYVVGLTNSDTFPHSVSLGSGTGPGATRGRSGIIQGPTFVSKLSPDGKRLLYSTFLRGASGTSIVVDAANQAFVAGGARTGFATTTGAAQRTFAGGSSDAFITKLNSLGNALQYSTFIGGAGSDTARDVVVNNYGIAFITGSTDSSNFPTRAGAFQPTHVGPAAFIAALQNNGRSLYYSSYLGGTKGTIGNGIAMDAAWNAYVTGTTSDSNFPITPQAFQRTLHGGADAFWSKVVIAGDLRAFLSADSTSVARNGVVTYRAKVTNYGPDGSDHVVFADTLPKGMAYAGVYSANGDVCTQPPSGATAGTLTCSKARLERGQTLYMNVYLRAIAATGTILRNTVSGSAQTQDLFPANNTASMVVKVD